VIDWSNHPLYMFTRFLFLALGRSGGERVVWRAEPESKVVFIINKKIAQSRIP
jgi:hypothetical protein